MHPLRALFEISLACLKLVALLLTLGIGFSVVRHLYTKLSLCWNGSDSHINHIEGGQATSWTEICGLSAVTWIFGEDEED